MSMAMQKSLKLTAACALILGGTQWANAAGLGPIGGAFGETKPIIDVRVRYENVDQTGIAQEADAGTVRARLGFETGKAWNTSLLAEGEFVEAFVSDYNSTVNGKTAYPVVADPKNEEINRLQIVNTSIPQTTLTIGRQRINLDDQRFVGAVGWRQNEQTFDAVRVVNKGVKNLTVDAIYFNQVNRIFGKDSPQGTYEGDSFLGNVGYQFSFGKVTAFAYMIKIDPIVGVAAAVRDSNATYGIRYNGGTSVGKVKLSYFASYAQQSDYGDNPLSFDNDYYAAEVTASFRQVSGGVGFESLTGDGVKGFTTPLATLHKFQGWADKFLATPANGLNDMYVNLGWSKKGVGPLDTLSATASYHDFKSQRLAFDAGGSEVDLQLLAKWHRFTGVLKYGDYMADGLFTDTKKLWVQVEYVW